MKFFSRALVPIWLVALALPSLHAAGPDRLLQSELKQQQIQRTTQRVGEQLSAIIDEFERNGIAGDDVRVLRAIRSVLHRLSDKEMATVVAILQQAQKAGDDNSAKKGVVEAYASQKGLYTRGAAGRHRHHRDPDCDSAAGAGTGQGTGQSRHLHEQSPATAAGHSDVCGRLEEHDSVLQFKRA